MSQIKQFSPKQVGIVLLLISIFSILNTPSFSLKYDNNNTRDQMIIKFSPMSQEVIVKRLHPDIENPTSAPPSTTPLDDESSDNTSSRLPVDVNRGNKVSLDKTPSALALSVDNARDRWSALTYWVALLNLFGSLVILGQMAFKKGQVNASIVNISIVLTITTIILMGWTINVFKNYLERKAEKEYDAADAAEKRELDTYSVGVEFGFVYIISFVASLVYLFYGLGLKPEFENFNKL
tara:strand:- start:507 stop:1217 length:711 start_codon:yes stop_codon:yes gene_type:complete